MTDKVVDLSDRNPPHLVRSPLPASLVMRSDIPWLAVIAERPEGLEAGLGFC